MTYLKLIEAVDHCYRGQQVNPLSKQKQDILRQVCEQTGCSQIEAVTALANYETVLHDVWLDVSLSTAGLILMRNGTSETVYLSPADVLRLTPALLVKKADA